jgi:tRNA 2-selenouridine synthase
MKYPLLQTFEQILPTLGQFDAIIDTRSPGEFAQDHIPSAINCPVLNDEERIRVGTLYKQVNSFEAKKVGAALVAHNIARHIEQWWLDKPRDWKPLVYCWRGGNRSGAMAHILAKIGWPVVQLEGGYKAYRQHVFTSLDHLPECYSYRVLCGPTGSGKTCLLQTLGTEGAQVLDLEQLAAHRGSVLGELPHEPQPSQKYFESQLWQQLSHFDPQRPVFVESESKKIGNLRLPDKLLACIRHAPCIPLLLAMPERIQFLLKDYQFLSEQPSLLCSKLEHLLPLHGREKIRQWQALVNTGQMAHLVEQLLLEHYDPAYQRSIGRNFALFPQATALVLDGIGTENWQQAAKRLLNSIELAK